MNERIWIIAMRAAKRIVPSTGPGKDRRTHFSAIKRRHEVAAIIAEEFRELDQEKTSEDDQ